MIAIAASTTHAELLKLVVSRASSDGSHLTALPGLQIVRKSVMPVTRHMTDVARICYVVQGAKAIYQDEHRLIYDASKLLVLPLSVPLAGEIVKARASRPMFSISMALDLQELAAVLRLVPSSPQPSVEPETYCPVWSIDQKVLSALSRYAHLLQEPDAIPALSDGLRREFLYRLLMSAAGAHLRTLVIRRREASQMAKAVIWFRQRALEPTSMRLLADASNMSEPSMFRAFRAYTSMSPLQYQKQLRLQEARRLLLGGADLASVSTRVGYKSLSQFNREYKRFFNAPPKQDVLRLLAQELA